MTYSNLYFGKDLATITYEDVRRYFEDDKDESDKIEYKSYHASDQVNHVEREKGIIKTIVALLNSEGGIIIWGAPLGSVVEGKKEKIFTGELSPLDRLIEKDAFINRITDLITPAPRGVNFHRVQNGSQFIYIIEVQQSDYSPHQYQNNYFMRLDGQTKIAPHHYIEALFRKVTFPKLEGYVVIDQIYYENHKYNIQLSVRLFNKSKLQNEHNIYYRLYIKPGTFLSYRNGLPNRDFISAHELAIQDAKPVLYYNEPLLAGHKIWVMDREVAITENEIQFILFFGGKQSPLMVSEYSYRLNENNEPELLLIKENKFMHEISDERPGSEAEKMRIALGR
ncbi:AlbA family DNA-binding domain-containing protein [Mucilaginibacter paludis]|uniref:AAA-4 family protein n=1 Tax=Mucilaginibacter paludis DSM 18603 TaxID=714943 RepID=H1YHA0_9SPHI|nr:ATP-binding protein [Mucilaginibacter paludis]EHQ24602.1 AAA-4 family protein [Mucilaginibacter paludis DSM 18603]